MLRIPEAILTENKLLAFAKELKLENTWKTTLVDTSEMMKEALATLFTGNRFGAAYDVTDHELLGVEALSD
jgi:gamma-glutamyl:cysteine ligase YbdK (ATP-grasp superfamily)